MVLPILAASLLFSCGKSDDLQPQVEFSPITYEELSGWRNDNPASAIKAFRRSCTKMIQRPGDTSVGGHTIYGKSDDWRLACEASSDISDKPSSEQARQFFEAWFQPFEIIADDKTEGLFTGYYEPLLLGSRKRAGDYKVPLHLPPEDLVRVDLGQFDPDLEGRSIRGRIEGQDFIPYYSRDDIVRGALEDRELELVWVNDEIEKFFLQIQGSGQVRLDDGTVLRVGYAEQNGLPYRAIGRDLIEIGALTPERGIATIHSRVATCQPRPGKRHHGAQ